MTRSLLLIAVAGLLLACGASAPVRYYSLPALPVDDGGGAADGPALAVGPLRIAEYLDRPQIVRLGPGAAAQVDEYARWVEPLDDGVPRVLAANLAALLPELVVVAYPYGSGLQPDYRLTGRLNRLDCDADGRAWLEIQWVLRHSGDEAPRLGPAAARYSGPCPRNADPAAVADALGQRLAEFSRDLAARLRAAGIAAAD